MATNVQELADDLRTELWVLREFAPDIFTRDITGIDTITDADAEMVRECWVMEDLGETEYPAWLEDAEHLI